MPEHVAIGVALRNSLRLKEFITILNRYGDCISYDDCLAIDAYWASEIVMNGNDYATKLTNIFPNKFTQATTDESDYMQENSSQHITNSVLYQYDVEGRCEYNIRSGNVVK